VVALWEPNSAITGGACGFKLTNIGAIRLFDGVPDRVNKLSDAADDALVLRSLIGTSHHTIHALGLPVLPLLEGFGNGIVSSLVSAPGLP
jgi:hypothetical protein